MLTNFELKRLKPKLDIVKKPENRVHELTDSNVSRGEVSNPQLDFYTLGFIFQFSYSTFIDHGHELEGNLPTSTTQAHEKTRSDGTGRDLIFVVVRADSAERGVDRPRSDLASVLIVNVSDNI